MSTDSNELRQKLAAIEHERWADWQKWCHKVLRERLGDNNMPLEIVLERWERQIRTPYDQLTDQEEASDMEQVDRYWQLVTQYADRKERAGRIDEIKMMKDQSNRYNPDPQYTKYPFHVIEEHAIDERLAELHQTGRSGGKNE